MERTIRILDDITWLLEQLAAEMRMARKWGNRKELSQMIDLGLTITDDLIGVLKGIPSAGLSGPIFPSENAPKTFKECLKFIESAVRSYRAKSDQHLEVLASPTATASQKKQELSSIRRLQEITSLQVRNRARKCKNAFPGKWSEAEEEKYQLYMKLLA